MLTQVFEFHHIVINISSIRIRHLYWQKYFKNQLTVTGVAAAFVISYVWTIKLFSSLIESRISNSSTTSQLQKDPQDVSLEGDDHAHVPGGQTGEHPWVRPGGQVCVGQGGVQMDRWCVRYKWDQDDQSWSSTVILKQYWHHKSWKL